MATLEEDGWELESAEERHVQDQRFQIPSSEERTTLRPGTQVKLLFLFWAETEPSPLFSCERMFVRITGVFDSAYEGVLESLPVSSDVLEPGTVIHFGPEHIATIMIPKTDPRHPDYAASTGQPQSPPSADQPGG